MKIMFIVPPYSSDIYTDTERETNWDYHSLGLAYMASIAESLGHQVNVLDCEAYQIPTNKLKSYIEKFTPHVIGMQVFSFTAQACYEISKVAKEINSLIKIVLGGLYPTMFPNEAIKQNTIDFIIKGEGEIVFENLLKQLNNGNNYNKVNGLIWKNSGKPIFNKPEQQIRDIDKVPYPALHLFPLEKYHSSAMMQGNKTLHMVTSRGCSGKCSFCVVPKCFSGTFRNQSANHVIEELKFLIKKYNFDSFQFLDDCFTYDKNRVTNLCNLLLKEKINLPWTCFSRVDNVDYGLLKIMKYAGCYQVIYGVETAVPRLLKILNKNISQDHIKNAFELTERSGIEGMASLMIGIPTETKEDTFSTINFLNKTKANLLIYHRFNPWEGVPLYDYAIENGTVICKDKNRYLLKWTDVVYIPHGRTLKEILETEKKCLRKFYLRPKHIMKTLNNMRKLPISKSINLIKKGLKDLS